MQLRRRILVMRIKIGITGIIINKTRRGRNKKQMNMIITKMSLPSTGINQKKSKKRNQKNNLNQIQNFARLSGIRSR